MELGSRLTAGYLPTWLHVLLAAGIYAALNLASIKLASFNTGSMLTYIWPGTSWLCVCLLALPDDRSRGLTIGAAAASDFLLGLLFVDPLSTTIVVVLINLVCPVTAWLGLRSRDRLRFDRFEDQLVLLGVSVVASFASAVTGAFLATFSNELSVRYVTQWFQAELLGLLVLLPSLTVLFSGQEERQLTTASMAEKVALPMLACVVCAWALKSSHIEFLILVMPILTAIAFRLGARHSAATTLLLALTALAYAKMGLENSGRDASYMITDATFIQAFIAVAFLTSVPAALAITEQANLRERLLEEQKKAQTAQRAAEVASAAKSDFVATMSHELRSPLNAVIGFTQLLSERRDLDGDVQRDVARIKNASDALLVVINDVLEFSAIEQRGIRLEHATFFIGELTAATVAILEGGAQAKSLKLTRDVPSAIGALAVVGDASRLRQILLNLVSNAIKFTDTGEVKLSVKQLDSGAVDTAAMRFEVSDTGPGIAREQLPLLFERFSQLDSTRNRNHGGSGLGLAICKQLVEAMNGRIGVVSEPGTGSVFWFEVTLPLGDSAFAEAVPSASVPAASGAAVLVVDDIELNRDIAEAMLQKSGYRVSSVSSGAEAVAAVYAREFDLVLMDIQMPGMDGFEATRQIRLSSGKGMIPIVAMTANVAPDEVARCLAAGMNAHIGKPFQHSALIATIEAEIGTYRTRREMPA